MGERRDQWIMWYRPPKTIKIPQNREERQCTFLCETSENITPLEQYGPKYKAIKSTRGYIKPATLQLKSNQIMVIGLNSNIPNVCKIQYKITPTGIKNTNLCNNFKEGFITLTELQSIFNEKIGKFVPSTLDEANNYISQVFRELGLIANYYPERIPIPSQTPDINQQRTSETLLQLIDSAFNNDEWFTSRQYITEDLRDKYPSVWSTADHIAKAMSYFENKNFESAKQELDGAQPIDSLTRHITRYKNAIQHITVIENAFNTNKFEDVINYVSQLYKNDIRKKIDFINMWYNEANTLIKIKGYMEQNKFEDAFNQLTDISVYPHKQALLNMLQGCNIAQQQEANNIQEAIRHYQNIVRIHPKYMSFTNIINRHIETCIVQDSAIITKDKSFENQGNQQYVLSDFETAKDCYNRIERKSQEVTQRISIIEKTIALESMFNNPQEINELARKYAELILEHPGIKHLNRIANLNSLILDWESAKTDIHTINFASAAKHLSNIMLAMPDKCEPARRLKQQANTAEKIFSQIKSLHRDKINTYASLSSQLRDLDTNFQPFKDAIKAAKAAEAHESQMNFDSAISNYQQAKENGLPIDENHINYLQHLKNAKGNKNSYEPHLTKARECEDFNPLTSMLEDELDPTKDIRTRIQTQLKKGMFTQILEQFSDLISSPEYKDYIIIAQKVSGLENKISAGDFDTAASDLTAFEEYEKQLNEDYNLLIQQSSKIMDIKTFAGGWTSIKKDLQTRAYASIARTLKNMRKTNLQCEDIDTYIEDINNITKLLKVQSPKDAAQLLKDSNLIGSPLVGEHIKEISALIDECEQIVTYIKNGIVDNINIAALKEKTKLCALNFGASLNICETYVTYTKAIIGQFRKKQFQTKLAMPNIPELTPFLTKIKDAIDCVIIAEAERDPKEAIQLYLNAQLFCTEYPHLNLPTFNEKIKELEQIIADKELKLQTPPPEPVREQSPEPNVTWNTNTPPENITPDSGEFIDLEKKGAPKNQTKVRATVQAVQPQQINPTLIRLRQEGISLLLQEEYERATTCFLNDNDNVLLLLAQAGANAKQAMNERRIANKKAENAQKQQYAAVDAQLAGDEDIAASHIDVQNALEKEAETHHRLAINASTKCNETLAQVKLQNLDEGTLQIISNIEKYFGGE